MQPTQQPAQAKSVPVQQKQTVAKKPTTQAQVQQKPVAGKQVQPAVKQPPQAKKKSKWWLWLIVIIFSIGAGFLAGYFI